MIVTRIAPSPTGMMHIGTARTALFNYLLARQSGGKFLVRIEDTDRERSTDEATKAIFDGLDWLGLDFDGEAVYQSANAARHVEVAQHLLNNGLAYRCYLTQDETAALKTQGTAFRSPYRDPTTLTDSVLLRRIGTDAPYAIRFRGPTEGKVVINDLVRGEVAFDADGFDDLVLLRADGSPTYNLAVLVDDHDMGITHVVRGDDHLSNAGRQALIIDALGWTRPVYAHIPLIFDDKGKKLSKRSGTAVALSDYADAGYTPDAVFNYLCRMGWGGAGEEIFDADHALKNFDVNDIVRSPARVDEKKLNAIAVAHFTKVPTSELAMRFSVPETTVEVLRNGVGTFVEFRRKLDLFEFANPIRILTGEGRNIVELLIDHLGHVSDWTHENLVAAVRSFTEVHPMKVVGPVARLALLGVNKAPDLPTILTVVGKDLTLSRLHWSLSGRAE